MFLLGICPTSPGDGHVLILTFAMINLQNKLCRYNDKLRYRKKRTEKTNILDYYQLRKHDADNISALLTI